MLASARAAYGRREVPKSGTATPVGLGGPSVAVGAEAMSFGSGGPGSWKSGGSGCSSARGSRVGAAAVKGYCRSSRASSDKSSTLPCGGSEVLSRLGLGGGRNDGSWVSSAQSRAPSIHGNSGRSSAPPSGGGSSALGPGLGTSWYAGSADGGNATPGKVCSVEGSEPTRLVAEPESSSMVPPPWGPDRANKDQPPWEKIFQQQQDYHRMLDQQRAQKADWKRQCAEQNLKTNVPSAASLATSTHRWEVETNNPVRARAIFEELRSTVASRQYQQKMQKEAEREVYSRCAAESELEFVQQWHQRKQRNRQEWTSLADEWHSAAEAKRTQQEQERAAALNAERKALRHLIKGTVPVRRIRKPAGGLNTGM